MADLSFFVAGVPVPQGSKSAFVRGGRAVIIEGASKAQRDRHAAWRADVTLGAARAHQGRAQLLGPLSVELEFFLPLPKSDAYRWAHVSAPDLDKLIRNVLDALTNSAVIRDDSQVFALTASKHYAHYPNMAGVFVAVTDGSEREASTRELLKEDARQARKKMRA
jgi:Holliday junction resolvase RusA-like endonuclease